METTYTLRLGSDDELAWLFTELRHAVKIAKTEFDPFLSALPTWDNSVWNRISQKLALSGKSLTVSIDAMEAQTLYEMVRRSKNNRGKKQRRNFGLVQSRLVATGYRPIMHI